MENNEKQQVAWNLSEALIEELAMLLRKATLFNIEEQYEQCFKCLKAVRMRINSNLDKDERASFKQVEEKLKLAVNDLRVARMNSEGFDSEPMLKWLEKNGMTLYDNIDSYNEKIMDVLEKYGFLVKKKEDKTKIN